MYSIVPYRLVTPDSIDIHDYPLMTYTQVGQYIQDCVLNQGFIRL